MYSLAYTIIFKSQMAGSSVILTAILSSGRLRTSYFKLLFLRAKLMTDGNSGTVTMGLRNCKAEDEGEFCCVLTSSKENMTKLFFSFQLLPTVKLSSFY